jgi:hypothetical protein
LRGAANGQRPVVNWAANPSCQKILAHPRGTKNAKCRMQRAACGMQNGGDFRSFGSGAPERSLPACGGPGCPRPPALLSVPQNHGNLCPSHRLGGNYPWGNFRPQRRNRGGASTVALPPSPPARRGFRRRPEGYGGHDDGRRTTFRPSILLRAARAWSRGRIAVPPIPAVLCVLCVLPM